MMIDGVPVSLRLLGDASEASKWLPFARAKFAELRRSGQLGRSYAPADGVTVQARVAGGVGALTIEAGKPWAVFQWTINDIVYVGNVLRKRTATGEGFELTRLYHVLDLQNGAYALWLRKRSLWALRGSDRTMFEYPWPVRLPPGSDPELVEAWEPAQPFKRTERFTLPRMTEYPNVSVAVEAASRVFWVFHRNTLVPNKLKLWIEKRSERGALLGDGAVIEVDRGLSTVFIAAVGEDLKRLWVITNFIDDPRFDSYRLYNIDMTAWQADDPIEVKRLETAGLYQVVGANTAQGVSGMFYRKGKLYVAIRELVAVTPEPTSEQKYPWRATFKTRILVYDGRSLAALGEMAIPNGGIAHWVLSADARYVMALVLTELRHGMDLLPLVQGGEPQLIDQARWAVKVYAVKSGQLVELDQVFAFRRSAPVRRLSLVDGSGVDFAVNENLLGLGESGKVVNFDFNLDP